MARRTKRRYTPRPGLVQAARDLECTASHLRRVIIGERPGKSLTAKFRAWQREQKEAKRAQRLQVSIAGQVAQLNTLPAQTQTHTP